MEDLTGLVFNDLTAVKPSANLKGHGQVWIWKCVCGKEVEYTTTRVKRGHTLSCGCRRRRNCDSKKICKHCGQTSYRKNRHGNFASVCQKCANKQCNDFKYKNPKSLMVACAKMRAKNAKVPFSITADDFEIPEHCPVLGVKLENGTRKYHDASPSLDRIIPTLGYVPGNIIVISFRANRIKGDASVQEMETVLNWYKSMLRPQEVTEAA